MRAALEVEEIALDGYSEAFTFRPERYRERIGYVLSMEPRIRATVDSSARGMDDASARFLVESGVHTVHTDVDGAAAPESERLRERLSLAQVEANIVRRVTVRRELRARRPTEWLLIEWPQDAIGVASIITASHALWSTPFWLRNERGFAASTSCLPACRSPSQRLPAAATRRDQWPVAWVSNPRRAAMSAHRCRTCDF